MVSGFNHNIIYKGEVFHVQTEDSGVANPHIITLLFKGGVILCSKKTDYADILKIENLKMVVEELMKEQHKDMMRRLKSGEFEERALSVRASTFENYPIEAPGHVTGSVVGFSSSAEQPSSSKPDIPFFLESPAKQPPAAAPTEVPRKEALKEAAGLDDAILTFFGANEK